MARRTPARLARDKRIESLRKFLTNGDSLTTAAEKIGVSRATAWNYAKNGGFFKPVYEGPSKNPRLPKKTDRVLTPEQKQARREARLKWWVLIKSRIGKVPAWVPEDFKTRYAILWRKNGEEKAAFEARKFKRVREIT